MNKKEALDKIRAIFSSEEKLEEVAPVETPVTEEEVIEVTFVEVKTEDGKILRVDDIAVTSTVVEITQDGEMPVQDGTYVLEDGNSLVVVEGIITEIIEGESEEEVSEVETEEPVEASQDFSDIVNEFTSVITELRNEIKEIKEDNKNLANKVEEFSKMPSVESIKTKVDFYSTENKTSILRNMLK